ncbi:MAG: hypothetical protein NXH85_13890 [Pseudomonadaceae bacterium]|nr:hypothetical protein [Pseudomonadaceae bacterium]
MGQEEQAAADRAVKVIFEAYEVSSVEELTDQHISKKRLSNYTRILEVLQAREREHDYPDSQVIAEHLDDLVDMFRRMSTGEDPTEVFKNPSGSNRFVKGRAFILAGLALLFGTAPIARSLGMKKDKLKEMKRSANLNDAQKMQVTALLAQAVARSYENADRGGVKEPY